MGPAIAGSSPELIRARVLEAAYPPGYTPKRDSHLMPAQPHLASHIEELAAFLAAAVNPEVQPARNRTGSVHGEARLGSVEEHP